MGASSLYLFLYKIEACYPHLSLAIFRAVRPVDLLISDSITADRFACEGEWDREIGMNIAHVQIFFLFLIGNFEFKVTFPTFHFPDGLDACAVIRFRFNYVSSPTLYLLKQTHTHAHSRRTQTCACVRGIIREAIKLSSK